MGFIYTDMTKKAFKLAFEKHKDQKDKSGMPYILHPISVAFDMDDEISCTIALLHDVVEDTDETIQDLEKEFPKQVTDALKLLTHDKSEDYFTYVKRIKINPYAKKVKLADLKQNMNLSRLDKITDEDLKRVEKYKQAERILKE